MVAQPGSYLPGTGVVPDSYLPGTYLPGTYLPGTGSGARSGEVSDFSSPGESKTRIFVPPGGAKTSV